MTEIAITEPGGPAVLQPRTVAVPSPQAGEVLVRVSAAGVNRPDLLQRAGNYPVPPGASLIPGLEVAGEVVALGPGVAGGAFALGDAVCGLTNGGGYAQYCVVPVGQLLPRPQGLSAVQAAAIPETFFTVWANLFVLGRARRGECVLIHGGTSGIGTTALLLCREFDIRALATAGSERKCAAIAQLGGEPINYREQDFAAAVLEKTQGRGVGAILDVVGAPYFVRNLNSLALDGRLLLVGMLGGARADNVPLQVIMQKRAVVTGSTMRARSAAEKAAIAADLRAQIWPALQAGRCLPVISAVLPLVRADEAHRILEAGDHIGKVVLDVAH